MSKLQSPYGEFPISAIICSPYRRGETEYSLPSSSRTATCSPGLPRS